jgi:pimeloyl-ACP methyl ester carboxylesterase
MSNAAKLQLNLQVLFGRDFGSYIVARAAAGREISPRIAALILDPGSVDPASLLQSALMNSLSKDLPELYRKQDTTGIDAWFRSAVLQGSDYETLADKDASYDVLDMRKFAFQSQFRRFGQPTLSSYLSAIKAFSAKDRAADISCPVLIVTKDSLPTTAQQSAAQLLESLTGTDDKMILALQATHGEHVGHESFARNVSYWLKDVLAREGRWRGERVVKVAARA